MNDEYCETCGRLFEPKFPGLKECVFCWAEKQPRIYEEKVCPGCGETFEPVLEWYVECPECYRKRSE